MENVALFLNLNENTKNVILRKFLTVFDTT